eukprot:gb/GEZJ01010119.1/.p1 GENE.gb/GEZJ01010119.1/~~gb/GEZJ01010119.1/.p1  ORF type:complete len:142 (+),score=10.85 gb/GEZJ01010119.1/:121-546(+)
MQVTGRMLFRSAVLLHQQMQTWCTTLNHATAAAIASFTYRVLLSTYFAAILLANASEFAHNRTSISPAALARPSSHLLQPSQIAITVSFNHMKTVGIHTCKEHKFHLAYGFLRPPQIGSPPLCTPQSLLYIVDEHAKEVLH